MTDRTDHESLLTQRVEDWRTRLTRLLRVVDSDAGIMREPCLEEIADLILHYRSVKNGLDVLRSAPLTSWREVKLEVDDAWFALQIGTVSMESRLGLTHAAREETHSPPASIASGPRSYS